MLKINSHIGFIIGKQKNVVGVAVFFSFNNMLKVISSIELIREKRGRKLIAVDNKYDTKPINSISKNTP